MGSSARNCAALKTELLNLTREQKETDETNQKLREELDSANTSNQKLVEALESVNKLIHRIRVERDENALKISRLEEQVKEQTKLLKEKDKLIERLMAKVESVASSSLSQDEIEQLRNKLMVSPHLEDEIRSATHKGEKKEIHVKILLDSGLRNYEGEIQMHVIDVQNGMGNGNNEDDDPVSMQSERRVVPFYSNGDIEISYVDDEDEANDVEVQVADDDLVVVKVVAMPKKKCNDNDDVILPQPKRFRGNNLNEIPTNFGQTRGQSFSNAIKNRVNSNETKIKKDTSSMYPRGKRAVKCWKYWDCTPCGKKFVSKEDFVTHNYIEHIFKCNLCLKGFKDIGSLLAHNRKRHSLQRLDIGYGCQVCGQIFREEHKFEAHQVKNQHDKMRWSVVQY